MAQEALLAEVATLYYVERYTQEEIARRIGRSIATVSRLLAKAHATEVVEVRVRSTIPIVPALQSALSERFGLRAARVARVSPGGSTSLAQISNLAGRLITTLLTDGAVIAVSWGATVQSVIQAIAPLQQRDLHVVQGLGSLGSRMPSIDNPALVQMLADRLEATPHFLPAPMIVESVSVRDALARDPYFHSTLELCAKPDVALIGIGAADPSQSGPVRAGYLDRSELEDVRACGAVGDIAVEFYDLHGRILQTDFGPRVMGMRQRELRNAKTVVAVAAGAEKVSAILGALRTGLIHILVTDNLTARQVLELDDAPPRLDHFAGDAFEATDASEGANVSAPARHQYLLEMILALLSHDEGSQIDLHDIAAAANYEQRDQLVEAIAAAQMQGDLPAEIDAGSVADMLLGAIWYRSHRGR